MNGAVEVDGAGNSRIPKNPRDPRTPSDPSDPSVPRNRWPLVRLGEVCEVCADGDWIESKDQAPSGIRLIQTGNVGDGQFENKEHRARYITEDTFRRLHCTEVFAEDVLISRLPDPVGRACKLPDTKQRMITTVDCTILRFKNLLIPDFFVLFTQTPFYKSQIDKAVTGSTRARISRKKLEQILLPLPPLATQRAIVERLDSALARAGAMEKRFAAIAQNAELSFKAMLAEEFGETREAKAAREVGVAGVPRVPKNPRNLSDPRNPSSPSDPSKPWPLVRLGDVCEMSLGKMLDKAKNHGEPHPYLRNVNVRWGAFDLRDLREMLAEPHDLPKYSAKSGDVVACEGGEPGRCAIWRGEPILLQKALHRIRPGKQVLAEYLCHLFALYAQNGTFAANFSGTTIKHLTGEAIASLKIPLPPLPVQRAIVSRLDAARKRADGIAALARQAAEAAANLRKALLKEAFE